MKRVKWVQNCVGFEEKKHENGVDLINVPINYPVFLLVMLSD